MNNRYRPSQYILNNYIPVPECGCWLWIGGWSRKGYGRTTGNGLSVLAHRIFYSAHVGPIPDGMMVCHKCDTPACCNPAHLFLGTAADNNDDMVAKKRSRAARGTLNGSAKLTENEVREIFYDSRPYSNVAADYCVSTTAVSRIKRGLRWAHLGLLDAA